MITPGPSILRLAEFVNGYPFKPQQLGDVGLPVIRIRQLVDESADCDCAEPPDGAVIIDDGDLIFSWSGSLEVRLWQRGEALLNQHLFRVDPYDGVERRWLRYVLELAAGRLLPLMHGSAMTHVTRDMLRAVQVAVPQPEVQRSIADSLDAAAIRLHALIKTKRRMIGLLEERRTAITFGGVTNSAWPRVRLTLRARLGSGHTPSRDRPEWWENATIPWITTGDVARMRGDRIEYIEDTKLSISELGLANSAAELHPAGTVVLSRTASVGFSAIMGRPMATSQDFATWTCGRGLRPRFLLLCLRAMRAELLGRLAMGSTHKTIYMPDIEGIRIPVPSLEEQARVVDEVWDRLRPIDAAVDVIERQIDLLREHRQALITAAITGQLNIAKTAA